MAGFETTASPREHPGAMVTGTTVVHGPYHCVTVHGGCDWCHAHGFMPDAPARCACGRCS